MLNDEELTEFLNVLTEFMSATGLSMSATAGVFGVNSASLSRWYGPRRAGVSRWVANSITWKLDKLNAANARGGIYAGLTGKKKKEKLATLQRVLQGTPSSE